MLRTITLKSKKEIARDTYEFIFEKPEDFEFQAGQHIEMRVDGGAESSDGSAARSLTIASSPEEADLRFAVRDTGSGFKRALKDMPEGGKVSTEGPFGDFVLHGDVSRPAVLLIGGIGITAARSIIHSAAAKGLGHEFYLFYSNRRVEDAAYLSELKALAEERERFRLIPVATKEEGREGEKERINMDMIRRYRPRPEGAVYYIAGPADMVQSMRRMLAAEGVDDLFVKSEEFSGY